MNAPRKLQANTDSEITRLKKLWIGWSDAEREAWRSLFASDTSQSAIRQQLKTELGLKLNWDSQLTGFRKWMAEQDARDQEAELTVQDQTELEKLGLSGEALRDALLDKIKARAYLSGDHKLGLQAVDRDLKAGTLAFDQAKFKEGLKSKLESGLDALAEAFKANPEAMKLYEQARALIARETK